MRRYDRIAVCVFTIFSAGAIALLVTGCERIPDHIMNSPPAAGSNIDTSSPKGEQPQAPAPPVESPRPQDRVASFNSEEPTLAEEERSPEENLQQAAAHALARIGAPSVPSLVAELHAENAERREAAAQVLARIGPDAVEAALPLVERLEDTEEDANVKLACANALKEIGPAIWPEEPQPYLEPYYPEALTAASNSATSDSLPNAITKRRETLRIQFEERQARKQQAYEQQLREYERKRAIAERAVVVLNELAINE